MELNINKHKCKLPDGIIIKPDGVNELDPCLLETKQILSNCLVIVSRCKNCGSVSVSWKRTEQTEEIPEEEWDLFI